MLGDAIAGALPELRRAAESMMRDTCTVHTVTGQTVDDLTGKSTPIVEPVYEGPCRVQTYEPYEANPEAGGGTATVQRYAVHVPVASFRPEVGQVVTVTASVFDPHLVGREFRVVALLHKTAATAYRLSVEETT